MKDIKKIQEFFSKPLEEAKTAVDMAKKQLDALGVKYEMSKTDKVRPFKVIYKPINKSDKFYDEFEDIVDLFNLKGVVKSSMSEASKESVNEQADHVSPMVVKAYKEYIKAKKDSAADVDFAEDPEKAYRYYLKKLNNTYSTRADRDAIEAILKQKYGSALEEASKEEETEFHKKLDTLVHNTFGKRKGELEEAYVPSNIKDFAKRKGVSSLVNKVAGWAEKVGKRITGGTAIGYNYSTLILDMEYQGSEIRINTDNDTIELYGEPVRSFNGFQRAYIDGQDDNIEENVAPNHDGKAAPYGSGYKPLKENKKEDDLFEITPNQSFKIFDFLKTKLGEKFLSEFPIKSYFYIQLNNYLKEINETNFDAKREIDDQLIFENTIKGYEWDKMSKEDRTKLIQKHFPKLSLKFADWNWDDLTPMIKNKLTGKSVKENTDYMKRRQSQNDYAINKKDKPSKSTNPKHSGKTDYMKNRQKELTEIIFNKLKK